MITVVLVCAACAVEDRSTKAAPEQASSAAPPLAPATKGASVQLPFDNPFPNRWNASNDGTSYEPCNAFSSSELGEFGIDSTRIEDAAVVDGQGVRGCRWFMPGIFSMSQLVTNSTSLTAYRDGTSDFEWKQDLSVEGRAVGMFDLKFDSTSCSTYVQSFSAGVVTNFVISSDPESRGAIDPCKLVEDFTRAYIDKIPN
ncbi:DUF3558 family protein [Williamsia muralis]|uniref:DUF3558 family protein n=1 Tax=Williamsia marianensis TaxID=85044 RepID=UPI00381814A1